MGRDWVEEGNPRSLSHTRQEFKFSLFSLVLEGMENAGSLPFPVRFSKPCLGAEERESDVLVVFAWSGTFIKLSWSGADGEGGGSGPIATDSHCSYQVSLGFLE